MGHVVIEEAGVKSISHTNNISFGVHIAIIVVEGTLVCNNFLRIFGLIDGGGADLFFYTVTRI